MTREEMRDQGLSPAAIDEWPDTVTKEKEDV